MSKYLHILILIAFLGGIIAPACGFSWGGKYSVVEICTAQGIELKLVDGEGQPAPKHTPKIKDQCQFCVNHQHLAKAITSDPILIHFAYTQEKLRFSSFETAFLKRFETPIHARAPPVLV